MTREKTHTTRKTFKNKLVPAHFLHHEQECNHKSKSQYQRNRVSKAAYLLLTDKNNNIHILTLFYNNQQFLQNNHKKYKTPFI